MSSKPIIIIGTRAKKDYEKDEVFEEIVHTPQPEQSYILKYHHPWEFDSFNHNANIMLVSLDFPVDSTGDLLIHRLMDKHNQQASLITLGDLYVNNQLICLINSLDALS